LDHITNIEKHIIKILDTRDTESLFGHIVSKIPRI